MNKDTVNETLSDILRKELDDLIFRFDFSNSPRIFVEGSTDRDFFVNHISLVNKGTTISLSKNNNDMFSKKALSPYNNNKELAMNIVDYIERNHSDWKAYALIDRDHFNRKFSSKRILCDQTAHDIETMLMRSDASLLNKCGLNSLQIRNSYFYSYQYGKIQVFLKDAKGIHLRFDNFKSNSISKVINNDTYEINVRAIFKEFKKNITDEKLDEYLIRLQNYYPDLYEISTDKGINLKWIMNFEPDNLPTDLFTTMRGHDVADIIRYIKSIKVNSENDRSIEKEWDEKYDCLQFFDNTGLYIQLNNHKLLKKYFNFTQKK